MNPESNLECSPTRGQELGDDAGDSTPALDGATPSVETWTMAIQAILHRYRWPDRRRPQPNITLSGHSSLNNAEYGVELSDVQNSELSWNQAVGNNDDALWVSDDSAGNQFTGNWFCTSHGL